MRKIETVDAYGTKEILCSRYSVISANFERWLRPVFIHVVQNQISTSVGDRLLQFVLVLLLYCLSLKKRQLAYIIVYDTCLKITGWRFFW